MSQEIDKRNDNHKKDYYLDRVYRCNQGDCRSHNGYGYLSPFSKDMIDHLIIEHGIDKPELYLEDDD